MRILFIQKEGGIFGAENFQLKIIPALKERGVNVEFLRLYTNYQGGIGGDFIDRLEKLNVKTYEENIGKFPKPKVLSSIKALITKGKYDIVHTHLIHADLCLSLIKLFMGGIACPWISTKHGYDNKFTAKNGFDAEKQGLTPYYMLMRLSERLCDHSYTISHGLRNFFIASKATKAAKMNMIHYGFDFKEITNDYINSDFRKFKKQIVIAGRLVKFKGHYYLVKSLSLLQKMNSDVGLVIVGSGDEEENLKALVNELGLKDSVVFAGYSKEVVRWMYNSDVVAVPSISEGFGVVFLEAFSCKKPVVAWDVPAGNELMVDNETGYLVRPYEIDSLAKRINYILNNREESEEVGRNAYSKLKTYFTLDRMTQETVELYKKALN
ncbi:glycosyltransferase family 4 protein [Fulvivirga sediminis]|uniref:Glycosyltransferase family 4 protein n=1 Tax=Fulvivirga sediminis TaxID=2803949 RepID=A0A937F6T9_9BACT|nr:glycosyltransferase family 4 protein [Fulvivirga sediminis]MBL3655380.1 glycosyltransferase family 4 protein [Fulvivirga sediminis]